jgi:tetratricopeptide (TPR) repeat protein
MGAVGLLACVAGCGGASAPAEGPIAAESAPAAAASTGPDDAAEALRERVAQAFAQQRWAAAELACDELLGVVPDDLDALLWRATAAARAGRRATTASDARAVADAPAATVSHLRAAATMLAWAGDGAAALRALARLAPGDLRADDAVVHIAAALRVDDLDAAVAGARRLDAGHGDYVAQNALGAAAGAAGDLRDAADYFARAHELAPAAAPVARNLARALLGLGDRDGALAALRDALESAPQDPANAATRQMIDELEPAAGERD